MNRFPRHLHFLLLSILTGIQCLADDPVFLEAAPQKWNTRTIEDVAPDADCFAINLKIDPVEAVGGDIQVVCGFTVGMMDENADAKDRRASALTVDFREGGDRTTYQFWHRDKNLTLHLPDPKPAGWVDTREYQHPHVLPIRDHVGHDIRLVVWPEGSGSKVQIFVDSMDRPKEEHLLEEKVTAGSLKMFSMRGGAIGEPTRTSRFSDFSIEVLTVAEAKELPQHWEVVLGAIDSSHPSMVPVAQAIQKGKMEDAKALFLRHMRIRKKPQGPTWKHISPSVLHPDYRKISDALLQGQFATIGYFDGFVDAWTDTNGDTHRWVLKKDPLQLNWAKDNGYLNRHFHWLSLAKSWEETDNDDYAKRFSDEVFDWVSREPFFWDRTPIIGGLNIMDGTMFRWGYMNTSNIGRRLELTWWPAYEVFRKSPDFSDEAHFAMLVGIIRQADLITNPTSFAVHDDGAAHTTMALLQTALMLPEFAASREWEKLALTRWDEMLNKQFHPDGSHVSLSTGYNWATILTLENFIRLYHQLGRKAPQKYFDLLEGALEHPVALSTPNQSQIPLNDGGWGMVDDHYQRSLSWFPHRKDFRWMATKGKEGSPPEETSLYLPNAGQYVMRTGWGEDAQYLFFGAGPWGASHGKQDALNIFTQFGNHLLIRDAGRGSYSGIGNTVHAGRSLSFNTLSPDWAQENSIPHWRTEMFIGFHPPKRRWISNENYDYGEGAFSYGWHRPGEHIQGKWVRQVIFVKGAQPEKTGYYVVIDTVEPADNKSRTWRHPWQLNPDAIEIRGDNSIVAGNAGAVLQILPVDPQGTMTATMTQGQETPELLGWRVYDTTAKPWPVPTYEWQTDKTFCRAWVIQMQGTEAEWPVTSVETMGVRNPGELQIAIQRKDGGIDHLIRRFPGSGTTTFNSETVAGDVAIISRDARNQILYRLEISGGRDSVAAPISPAPSNN